MLITRATQIIIKTVSDQMTNLKTTHGLARQLKQVPLTSVLIVLAAVTPSLQASTILQVDVQYMLEHTELIFEGEVVSSQSAIDANNTIVTRITFRIDDLIKGQTPTNTLTLNFAGGIVGQQGMHVSAMVYPKLGERGIYFVESSDNNLVNPLVGWGQGHFLLEQDGSGEDRLLTEQGLPVVSMTIDASGETPQSVGQTTHRHQTASSEPVDNANENQQLQQMIPSSPFSHGVARGLSVGDHAANKAQAISKASFKRQLRAALQKMAAEPAP